MSSPVDVPAETDAPGAATTTTRKHDGRPRPRTVLIGLSGPSSSGKTTLARLLRSIFTPPTTETETGCKLSLFVLHEDDFYKTDTDIPYITVSSPQHGTRRLQDWDCVESLDLPLFERTLSHVRDHGTLPPDTSSKEDQNSVGESGVSEAEVEQFREQVQEWFDGLTRRAGGQKGSRTEIRICVLEGFLLFPPPPPSEAKPTTTTTTTTPNDLSSTSASQLAELYQLSRTLLSSRLFLPLQREQMLARRLARSGYVTLEGFWADPPGYVEDVVWPNYARDHAWMYADGDVDRGIFKDQVDGVDVCPGRGTWTLKQCLAWAVAQVRAAVEEKVVGSGR